MPVNIEEEYVTKAANDKDMAFIGLTMVLAGVGIVALAMGQMKTERILRSVAGSHLDLIRSHTADHNLLMNLANTVEELVKD